MLPSPCVAAKRAGVIVAAGASERMGQPKALLAWRGSTLVDYAIQQARLAGVEDLAVVLGPATHDLRLDALIAFNADPETGRSTSIRLGAERLADDVTAVLIQSVDQPVYDYIVERLLVGMVIAPRAEYRSRKSETILDKYVAMSVFG